MFEKFLNFMKIKKKLSSVIGLAIVAAAFLAWYLFSGNDSAPAESVTASVTRGNIEVTVSGTGAVQPSATRSITPNQSGTIAAINVKNGERVAAGRLLFELNNDSIQTEIKKAKLDLQQAQLEYNIRLDERKQQYIYAPISGQIGELKVDSGTDVQKNGDLLTIDDTSKLSFKVPVNGAQVTQIKVAQIVDVTIPSLMQTLQGRVKKVDRGGTAGSDGSKMHDITIELTNPGAIAPGLPAQAEIHTPAGPEAGYEGGTLEWAQTVTVRAGVSGTIEQLLVDENDHVKKGQKLAYIAGDNIDLNIQSQQLRLEQARLSYDQAQKKMADCKIYAPVDGTINLNSAASQSSGNGGSNSNFSSTESSGEYWQVGDQVSTNEVLATLVDNAGMRVTVPVDEVDIAKVKMEQKAAITVDALPDETFAGTVTEIAAKGTEENGVASFDVTVSMDKADDLKENMTANVVIIVAKKDGALLLPVEAVQERQGRKFVLMAAGGNDRSDVNQQPGKADSRRSSGETAGANSNRPVRMVQVETGLYNDTLIEIISGVQEGDTVNLPNVVRSSGTGSGAANGTGGSTGNRQGGLIFGGGNRPPGGGASGGSVRPGGSGESFSGGVDKR